MQDKGLDRRFTVIDDADIQETVIETPQSFTAEPVSLELSRDEIKDLLTEKGVEFNPRTSTDKLNELLNNL
jgi:hypothetical protein